MPYFFTFFPGIDHVQYLTDSVLYREAVNVQLLKSLQHFLVEEDQFEEGENTVSVHVQAPEPILNTVHEGKQLSTQTCE